MASVKFLYSRPFKMEVGHGMTSMLSLSMALETSTSGKYPGTQLDGLLARDTIQVRRA
jgi:hypothetical protein